MKRDEVDEILNLTIDFVKSNRDVLAFALCGSWANDTAGPDSDLDLLLLTNSKLKFKKNNWVRKLGFEKINERVEYYKDENYGRVWSRHVFLSSKAEIEFAFADISWASTENVDLGTLKVVSDGFKILYDPQQILKELVEKFEIISEE